MDVQITKIEPQKRSRSRYSIYSGDEFLLGISQDTLLKFNLYTGKNLTEEEIKLIRRSELTHKLRDQALRYLSRRAHSCRELKDKLLHKGYDAQQIEQLIAEFKKRGYLNDEEYARAFADDEINLKHTGPLRIKEKLLKRGVHGEIIEALISEVYHMDKQIENCRLIAEKKFKNGIPADDQKAVKSLVSFLRSRGFTWEHISAIIPFITEEINRE